MSAWRLPVYSSKIQLNPVYPRVNLMFPGCLLIFLLLCWPQCVFHVFAFLSQDTACRQDEGRVSLSSSAKSSARHGSYSSLHTLLALRGVAWALQRLLAFSLTKTLHSHSPNWITVFYSIHNWHAASLYSVMVKPKRYSWLCEGNCSAHTLHNLR